ncbi:hypothetical protein ACSQ67_019975 [Phaseolus vulgaris]
MGLKGSVCVALFLSLNLLSVSMVTSERCRMNMAGLSACSGMLNLSVTVGSTSECCDTLEGMGVHAGVCLCDAARVKILIDIDNNFNIPILSPPINTILTTCGMPHMGSAQCH